ncbi:MAG: hypothetical protein FWC06_05430 [Treponema sp.]|nr:hypothetical protein [Treponema sp.]
MSLFRSVLLVCLVSLAATFGLLFLGSLLGYEEFRGGYAVLETDASVDDRMLRSLLEEGDIFYGGNPESESSQWVLLDEFDSIKTIPLDEFHGRIFPFDPRNDGYADLLRNVFINGDKRYIYIPLKAGNWNIKLLDKHFSELLNGIPFTVEYYGVGRPLYFFFISYTAASLCLLVICLLLRKKTRQAAGIVVLVPVFSSLAFFGAHGIACAALFIAFFVMLKEPLNELVTPDKSFTTKTIFDRVYPYRFHLICVPVFAAALFILNYFSQLRLLFLLIVFAAAFMVFIISMRIMSLSLSYREHKRFTPVLILKHSSADFIFSVYMMPFTVAAFIIILFAPYMSAPYDTNKQFNSFINEHEYNAHLIYQTSFSTRQMSTSLLSFPDFFFDADGLPSMGDITGMEDPIDLNKFPSFPLQHLMDFFYIVNSRERTNTGSGSGIRESLPLLVLLLFIFPGMFTRIGNLNNVDPNGINRKNERYFLHGKLRLMGINWNKKSVYNGRNPPYSHSDAVWRSQKDA